MLHRALSLKVNHTCLKKCNTACLDCSLFTQNQAVRDSVGFTESRIEHRWLAEYESDSQHFVSREACESPLSPSGNGPLAPATSLSVWTPIYYRVYQTLPASFLQN